MNVTLFPLIAAVAALVVPAVGCASAPRSFAAPAAATHAPLEIAPREHAPAPDYRIGPHDVLTLRVFELEEPGKVASLDLEVTGDGLITVPFLGPIPASNNTVTALRRTIADALGARFLVDPQVILTIKEYRSRSVAVMGHVVKPGVIYIDRNHVSLVEAISLAGGLSKEAGTRAVVIRSKGSDRAAGETDVVDVDLIAAIQSGDPASDMDLEPGMVVQIPAAEEFYVMGYVNKPGAFLYQRPVTVLQAVATAGGLEPRHASPSVIRITRKTPQGVEVVQVDLDAITMGKDPDVPIRPGDSIEAGQTIPKAIWTEIIDTMKGLLGFGITAGAL